MLKETNIARDHEVNREIMKGTVRHSSSLSLSRVCRVWRLKFLFQRKPGAWLIAVFSVLRQEDYQSGLHHGMLSLEKTKQGARGMITP